MGFLNGPEQETTDEAGVPTIMAPPSNNMLSVAAREPIPSASGPVSAPKKRFSAVDIIGRLADVGATIGGTPALYQSNLDASRGRANEIVDRDQKAQLFKQQIDANNQKFQAGNMEIDEKHIAQVGQATRGLKVILAKGGKEGVLRAWPLLAQQLKIPDDQKAMFGEALAADPEAAVNALDAAINPQPVQSPPREVQVYNMLLQKDPALAEQYIQGIADPHAITDYQTATLDLNRDRLRQTGDLGRERLDIAREAARRRAAGKKDEGATPESQAAFSGLLGDIRKNYDNLDAGGAMVRQGGDTGSNIIARARASGVGQLIEGAVGTNAQTYRDNIKNSRPAIVQAIKSATGMTSKQLDSNADMKLALQQATDTTQSIESNRAALARLERLVSDHKPAASAPRRNLPPSRSNRPAPAASGGWKIIKAQ